MTAKPKIYLFLNSTVADIETWIAVAEDGFSLASHSVPLGLGEVARMKLSTETKWRQNYDFHYPDGYEFETIANINAPENVFLLNRIRQATAQRADERKEQYKLAENVLKGMRVRRVSPEEVERLRATAN